MRARHLFPNDFPEMATSEEFAAALLMLRAKCRIEYHVMLDLDLHWCDAVGSAATDGVHIYVSRAFFLSLANASQRAFLLAHEVLHIILKHPQRSMVYHKRGYFRAATTASPYIGWNPRLRNIVEDWIINAECIANGLEPIPDGCYSDKYGRNDDADTVYAAEWKPSDDDETGGDDPDENGEHDGPEGQPAPQSDDGDDQSDGDQDGDGGGESDDESDDDGDSAGGGSGESGDDADDDADTCNGESGNGDKSGTSQPALGDPAGHDHHLTPEYDGTPEQQAAAQSDDESRISKAVDRGIDEIEREGGDSQGISPSIRAGSHRYRDQDAEVDWIAKLSHWFVRAGSGGESTWSRIHRRRYSMLGVISPTNQGMVNRVSIIVDTSGSVSSRVLNTFLTESAVLVDQVQPREGVLMVWTDTDVIGTDEVHSGAELLDLESPYGGGTYLSSATDWLEHNGIESDLTIVFTDGYLDDDDYRRLGECDKLVIVLDRQPEWHYKRMLDQSGLEYIVAEAA